jgi:uncharacterized repeat protein (TIGR01451 family)
MKKIITVSMIALLASITSVFAAPLDNWTDTSVTNLTSANVGSYACQETAYTEIYDGRYSILLDYFHNATAYDQYIWKYKTFTYGNHILYNNSTNLANGNSGILIFNRNKLNAQNWKVTAGQTVRHLTTAEEVGSPATFGYVWTFATPYTSTVSNVFGNFTFNTPNYRNQLGSHPTTPSIGTAYDAEVRIATFYDGDNNKATTADNKGILECQRIQVRRCGDGIPQTAYGEQCDNGLLNGTAGNLCSNTCQNIPAPLNPDMSVTKSVSGGVTTNLASGTFITYNVNFFNAGPGVATNVVITDTIQPGLTYVSSTNGGVYNTGTKTVTWTIAGTVANQAAGQRSVTVKVDGSQMCATIPNTASISATNDTNASNNTSPVVNVMTLCPPLDPDVTVEKTVSSVQGTYLPGNEVLYTITYKNVGVGTATNVEVTDNLPAELTYVAGSASLTPTSTSPLTWTIPTLAPGAQGTITFKAKINLNTPVCTNLPINNIADITATNEPAGLNNTLNHDGALFTMQCVDMRSKKTIDKATVASGDTVTYTITYGNSGSVIESGKIIDTLPAGMTYLATTTSNPVLGAPSTLGQTITWNIPPMIPGSQGTITFTAKVTAMTNGQSYVNTVCVDGINDTQVLNLYGNNCGTATTVGSANYDLSIDKNPKLTGVVLGQEFDYTLAVSNNGQVGVNNFTVKDYLPAGLQFVSASAGGTHNAGTVTWNNLSILAVETFYLTVRVKYIGPMSNGKETNWAEICDYNGVAGNLSNPHDTDSTPCNGTGNSEDDVSSGSIIPTPPAGNIDVNINKLVNGVKSYAAYSGEVVIFTMVVGNSGTVAANNFTVKDYLPAGLTFVAAQNGGTHSAGVVTWNGISLAPGATTTVSFTAKFTGLVKKTNYAEVCDYNGMSGSLTPKDTDSNPCNWNTKPGEDDDSSAEVTPLYIDLNINKLVNGVKEYQAYSGETVNFTMVVGNSGNTTATNFSVNDYLPAGLVYVQGSAGASYNSGTHVITWAGLTLASGASTTVSFSAIYTDTVLRTNYTEVCQYFGETLPTGPTGPQDIDSNPCDNGANPDTTEDDDSQATIKPKTDRFDLEINKLINGAKDVEVTATNTLVTVTLHVTNSGTVAANNFTVKDYMPAGLEYSGVLNLPAGATIAYDTTGRTVTIDNLSLPAVGSLDITFKALFTETITTVRTNYTEICMYNGKNGTGSSIKEDDSDPCNRGANPKVEDDESSATIHLKTDGG